MADWSALVSGFQQGANFRQNFRERSQLEKARDLGLEGANYDMQARRATRKVRDPETTAALGPLDPNSVQDWGGGLQDPFAYKLMDWFKSKMGRKKTAALDTGADSSMEPPAAAASPDPNAGNGEATAYAYPDYADGGDVSEADKIKAAAARNRAAKPGRVTNATENATGADESASAAGSGARQAINTADEAAGKFLGRAPAGSSLLKRVGAGIGRVGALGALAGTAAATASTPTEDYRKRFGLETSDPSLAGDIGVRTLGAASDLGNAMTMGLAGRFYRDKQDQGAPAAPQQAIPVAPAATPLQSSIPQAGARPRQAIAPQEAPHMVNFGQVDMDAKEVPNMNLDDWKKYRAQMVDAARKSGDPNAIAQVNDTITHMQQSGFVNYGQQGLALQQAGNVRGAMAAYRAAFQYFPNGNDVEFGTHRDRQSGQMQIVGFGKDEKSGKVLPGTEMVMDPERVSTIIENFKNPDAFRMWTKDWRDFQQKEREYQETKKPLAQAQASALTTNAAANAAQSYAAANLDNAKAASEGGPAAYKQADMRGDAGIFNNRVQDLALSKPQDARYLLSVMGQIKKARPDLPPDVIANGIRASYEDGTLKDKLAQLGIQ
jgi:hypothetical protein